ncbi:MAG: MerR family transcriptional regulator [Acidimicrobiales bacterium]
MTFSGKSAADIVGITYRQLDYWARTNLIRPTAADATGSGSRRQYTYKDLLELKVVKRLLDSGIKLTSVRDVFAYMREHVDTEISSAHIVIDGSSVVLCDGDNLIDVLRHGQGVLNVLPLAGVKDEIDRRIFLLEERARKNAPDEDTRDDDGRRAV